MNATQTKKMLLTGILILGLGSIVGCQNRAYNENPYSDHSNSVDAQSGAITNSLYNEEIEVFPINSRTVDPITEETTTDSTYSTTNSGDNTTNATY